MKQHLLTLFLALAASVAPLFAQSGTCGDNLTWTLDTESGILTISGTGAMYSYTSSSTTPWYSSLTSIKTVIIEDGVTSIGNNAFRNSSSLTSVTIGESVTSIGDDAFRYCSSLTSITMGNSVTTIGNYAFDDCSSLTSITIPNSVTSIGNSAFYQCTSLTSINVDAANSAYCDIDGVLFSKDKTVLVQYPAGKTATSYTIPDSVTSIGESAFNGCSSLTSITIPNSVTTIGNYAFDDCDSLTAINVETDNPVYTSSDGVLFDKEMTELIKVPAGKQGSCTIPESVIDIDYDAFEGCTGLTSLTIEAPIPTFSMIHWLEDMSHFSAGEECLPIYVPCGSEMEYMNELHYAYILPIEEDCHIVEPTTTCPYTGICGDNLTWENSCDGVLTIRGTGDMENYYTHYSSSPCFFASTDSPWGVGSFSVVLEEGVTSIGSEAFSYCWVSSLAIPNSITRIGYGAFRDCRGLVSVAIPNSVISIEGYAFNECYDLASVTIGDNVTSIGNWAFAGCSSLTSVTIGESVTSIGYAAFDDCTGLTSISIPNSVTTIEGQTFYGCSSLTSITIPNSVTSIGNVAFYGCSSLTSVTIPNSVTSIGDWAFSYCSGLTSVTCEAVNPPVLDKNVFTNVDKSIPLYVPAQSIDLYKAADEWKDFTNILPITSSTPATFTITFLNYDGSELQSSEVEAGTMPQYNGTEPTKPADAQYTYTFAGWDKEIATVTADATYTATYTRTVNQYTVTFMDGNKVLGEPQTVEYGQSATAPEVEIPQCRSLSWDKDFSKITGNLTVKAVWSTIPLASGTCGAESDGSNLQWNLSCEGVLTISGTGTMSDYSLPHGQSSDSFSHWTLYYDNTITSVITSQGVTSLGSYAFYRCEKMISVEIPNSVASIGKGAFSGCSGIQSIISKSVTPPALGSDVFYGVDKSIPLYVPAESLNAYKAADQWKDFWKILPDYLINDETLCPSGEAGQRDQFLYDRDSIVLDTYTDSNDDWLQYIGGEAAPQKWDYNKFIRVRAWSNRSENKDNYIQFYWWIGDGNNPALTQMYTNGLGPKAGTYTVTRPFVWNFNDHIYNNLYYWTLTDIPTYQPTLVGYRVHDCYWEDKGIVWVSPFSSYATDAGDLSNNNTNYVQGTAATSHITYFNSFPVTVDEGDDGNIFIQIGGQEENSMPAVTIGSRTVYKLNTSVEGEGMVYVNPNCEYHIVGETVNLVPVPSNQSIRFKGWIGEHADNVIFNGDGTYTFTMPEHDCSLTAKFEAIQPIDCTIETIDGITVWEDQLPYTWEGISFTTAGTETKTLQTSDGCDSIVTFTLRVLYRNITLQENEDADYYTQFAQDYNGRTVNTATLNRQFTQGKWATLCLPFNVNKALMTSLGLYNRVFEFRYAQQLDDETIQMYFAPAQTLEAGKGYIVNANTKLTQKTSFVFPNVTINTDSDNGDITALTGYNDGTGRGNLFLVGTLRTGMLQGSTAGNTYLGLKDNQLYYPNSTSGTPMRAYRAVFRSDIPVNASRLRIIADGESVTELEVMVDEQGRMDNVHLQNNAIPARKYLRNGLLFIERNGVTYTAQGHRIE